MTGIGNMLKLFQDKGVLPVDGMVDPEDYEAAKANSMKFKEIFVGLAKDEEERDLFNKLWPYQDQESEKPEHHRGVDSQAFSHYWETLKGREVDANKCAGLGGERGMYPSGRDINDLCRVDLSNKAFVKLTGDFGDTTSFTQWSG
ncbi:predicted protein [Uncinocarpus reesii 1704]|uniref:Uncharacterized protein n=1 Tax=Uncinocarpus reesii (strain UAMH 1704) TaxID=336963 RepID=C4JP70_UNCRE|nr:uncharacterized protein UREG_03129 [Uncinocarpus reesii 1704]EEP78284.1 predicted protein [Uncinocarpus reesii 1704]